MKLTYDEQQELFSQTARDFVVSSTPIDRIRKLRDTNDALGFSPDVWKKMAELGFTGIFLPEEYGGMGLGFTELCIVMEEAGRRLVPEPLVSTLLLGAQALLLGGTPVQKKEYLPQVASGDAILTVAYQERDSRFDPSKVTTIAAPTPQGARISGEKVHVLDGHVANAMIVSAQAPSGITLYLVDPHAPGVRITKQNRIDSRSAAIVTLDGVEVGEDAVVGRAGQGLSVLTAVLDRACVGISAEMLGGATQAFDDTLSYLKTRKQFDVTIGSFQALQHRAARLFIELTLARAAVLGAARTVDGEPEKLPKMAALAKARTSDAFVHVANEAVQMHGGIGVTDEFHIGFYLKRARVAEMTFGDATWHRKRWAEISGY